VRKELSIILKTCDSMMLSFSSTNPRHHWLPSTKTAHVCTRDVTCRVTTRLANAPFFPSNRRASRSHMRNLRTTNRN